MIAFLAVLLVVGGGVAAWLALRHHTSSHSSSSDGPFGPGQGGIPADWVVRHGSGWSIATPAGWHLQTSGSTIRYRRPAGETYGYIAVLSEAGTNAGAVLDQFGQQFAASHTAYHQVTRETTTFRGSQAPLLTATYRDSGTDLEASFLAVVAGDHVYLVWWQTMPKDWGATQHLRAQLVSTFRAPA